MVSKKLKTLEDKLQKDMENFFSEFSRDYFFVLSTKDYDPAATKELYCLCFNDTDNHDQKSENLFVQLLRRRNDPSFMLESKICLCRYAPRPFKRIKNLVEHYLQDHTLKLYEFLNRIAFSVDFHDQRMVNMASDLLLTWRDKDRERSKNSPKFNPQDMSQLRERMRINSTSSTSFSFLGKTSEEATSSIPQPTSITDRTGSETLLCCNSRNHSSGLRNVNAQYSEPVSSGAIDMSLINTMGGRADSGSPGRNIPVAHSQGRASAISKPSGPKNCQKSSPADVSPHSTNPPNFHRQVITRQSSVKRKTSTPLVRAAMSEARQMSRFFSNNVSKRQRPC